MNKSDYAKLSSDFLSWVTDFDTISSAALEPIHDGLLIKKIAGVTSKISINSKAYSVGMYFGDKEKPDSMLYGLKLAVLENLGSNDLTEISRKLPESDLPVLTKALQAKVDLLKSRKGNYLSKAIDTKSKLDYVENELTVLKEFGSSMKKPALPV